MKYCVIVRPEAEYDLKEIFSWYEDSNDFLLQVDAGSTLSREVLKFIRLNIKGRENTSSKYFLTKSYAWLKKKK